MRLVTIKAPEWLVELIDSTVFKLRGNSPGLTRSELIRAAVYYVLSNNLVNRALKEYEDEVQRRERSFAQRRYGGDTDIIEIELVG